jgi:hypothetical protein
VGPLTGEYMASRCVVSRSKFSEALQQLVTAGRIVATETSYFIPRMVEDEDIRQRRAAGGKLGGNPNLPVKHEVNLPLNLTHATEGYPHSRARTRADSGSVFESGFDLKKENLPLNGKTSARWEEFQALYPYRIELDDAARQFISVVSVDNEADVFACLARYLASDQVARGATMKPAKWLLTGHRDKWLSDWPKPPETAEEKKRKRMLED